MSEVECGMESGIRCLIARCPRLSRSKPTGLTPSQVGARGTSRIGVETLDDVAQRRLGHALRHTEPMVSCEAMGLGAYSYPTSETVGADFVANGHGGVFQSALSARAG